MTPDEQARLGLRKILVAEELFIEMAEASAGQRLIIDWGEPDSDGCYTPTLTTTKVRKWSAIRAAKGAPPVSR